MFVLFETINHVAAGDKPETKALMAGARACRTGESIPTDAAATIIVVASLTTWSDAFW